MTVQRLGVLGGTFDPPHIGHLWLAEAARDSLALDQILFVPAGQPPHKTERSVSPAHHRLAMIRLATGGQPGFVVTTVDIERPPPHYTTSLLPLIQQQYPDARLWFIVGEDSLEDLPAWHHPAELLTMTRLAVLERPGHADAFATTQKALPEITDVLDWIEGPRLAVSGTAIRARLRTGRSVRYLVPDSVAEYVASHDLYRPVATKING